MTKTVLIAHYDKDVSWAENIRPDINIVVYSVGKNVETKYPVTYTQNKGMDAGIYLRYIIDNYNNHSDRTLFLHHHREDWSQDLSSDELANRLKWNTAAYFNAGARASYWQTLPHTDKAHLERMAKCWEVFLPELKYPGQLISYAGSLFCVHKNLIEKRPLTFWNKLYDWIMTTDQPDWFSGRFFEWTWHYIFTDDPVEKKYDKIYDN